MPAAAAGRSASVGQTTPAAPAAGEALGTGQLLLLPAAACQGQQQALDMVLTMATRLQD